jgi:hypothetical protein
LLWVSGHLSILITSIDRFAVLHPRHKLQYFKNAGWEEEWVETARNIVRDEFDRTYAFMDYDEEVVLMERVREQFKIEYLSSSRLALPNTRSPRCHPTYSMIYLHYQLLLLQSFVTSLTDTLLLILSKLSTSASGGMKGGWRIHVFIVWR